MNDQLIAKYNVPCPRYTSYPTVPYWNENEFSYDQWLTRLKEVFAATNNKEGISVYIHLPFCESLCTFCGCNKRITRQHAVEDVYIKAVLKEWTLYCSLLPAKPVIKELHLGGGTPTFFSPDNLKRLLDGILNIAGTALQPEFSFEGHPNNTTKQHLACLYHLGFRRVSFGVQDYSPTIQRAINRIQPLDNVARVTAWAMETGYTSVSHDLVFGLPFQTQEDIIVTVNNTLQLRPHRLSLYSYAHVPWIKGNGQRGFKEDDIPRNEEKRLLYQTAKQMLLENGYYEIGMDHFALADDPLCVAAKEGTLHRNFMGYTTSPTKLMIGLGVSSIGDTWTSFAQNEKELEQYYQLLEANRLPVVRGHLLTPEDVMIREFILNIMCSMKTSWKGKQHHLNDLQEILFSLKEMEEDQLLTINDEELTVTERGRPFVRNICMAFDLRLKRKNPANRLFSMAI